MRRRRRALARALALLAVAAAAVPGDASAESLAVDLVGLELEGDTGWRAINKFVVDWRLAAGGGGAQPTAIEYRLEDEGGMPLGEPHQVALSDGHANVAIPAPPGAPRALPGAYRLLMWLRAGASAGPSRSIVLRFDDSRPPPVRPHGPTGWLRAGASAELTIDRPGTPRPPSGIRGYALALDRGSGAEPCGASATCAEEEIDLGGGEADDSIVIGPLAEGVNVVRAVAVSGAKVRSATAEAAVLRVDGTPPAIAIAGAPNAWVDRPLEVTATASDPLSGMSPAGPSGPITAIAVDGEVPAVAQGPHAASTVHGDGAHLVTAFARDAVGNLGAADPGSAARTVWIDETAPWVAFATAVDPAQPERIVATVGDALSGPSPRRGSIAIRPAGSRLPFEPLPTTVAAGRLVATWASDAYPRGEYEFRATGFDLAGNRGESGRRADGAAMVLGNPVKAPTTLAFGFGGRHFVSHACHRGRQGLRCHNRAIDAFARRPAATAVGYDRGVPVSGRLRDAAGAPLAGLPVTITETFAPGSEPGRRTTTATSGADGVFQARLDPGPSRHIAVAFAGTPTLTAVAGRELHLGVRAAVRLRASAARAAVGGPPVVFSGHLGRRGAALPAGGVPVELEFRIAGLTWSEFRTVQTDARGAFRFPYAFSDDDSRGVRFQFRAHLAPQPGWPYDPAYSRPIAVTGR